MNDLLRQPTEEGVQILMNDIMGKRNGVDLYFEFKQLFHNTDGAIVKDISVLCTKIYKFMGPLYNMKRIVEGLGITMQEWKDNG